MFSLSKKSTSRKNLSLKRDTRSFPGHAVYKEQGLERAFLAGSPSIKGLNDRDRPAASGIIAMDLPPPAALSLSSHRARSDGKESRARRCTDIVSPPRNWDGVLRAVIYDRGYEKGGGRRRHRPPPPPSRSPFEICGRVAPLVECELRVLRSGD